MAVEKVDRRVRRTKDLLRGALLSLIKEKGYERITVQEIIDRADVGRSTFYAHFRDKEDLLVYGLEELREPFTSATGGNSRRQGTDASPSLTVFEHFATYHDVWKAMAGRRGAEVFVRYLHEFLTELVRDQFRARAPHGPTQVPVDALVEFAVSTLLGLGMRWWQLGEAPYSARDVDQIYRRLTEPAIQAGLRPRTGPEPGRTSATSRQPQPQR
jgi:AcrR family transcriptional regulator